MGISISSKQKPKNLDEIDIKKDVPPKSERDVHRTSSRYLDFSNSDSGYPTTPQNPDNAEKVDNADVLSIDDLWIPTSKMKSDSQRNFFPNIDSSAEFDKFPMKDEIFTNGFRDNDSLTTLDIPGAVTSKDSIRSRDRRRRAKTSSSWTQSVKGEECDATKLRNDSFSATEEKWFRNDPVYRRVIEDEMSSACESDFESQRKRSTSNPRNRPGAARPRRRRVGAMNNKAEGNDGGKIDLQEYFLPMLASNSLLSNSSTIFDKTQRSKNKYEVKVSINPDSNVCEIILPGTFLFRHDDIIDNDREHGLKRHKSLYLPSSKKN